jgi:hypothetical protein
MNKRADTQNYMLVISGPDYVYAAAVDIGKLWAY